MGLYRRFYRLKYSEQGSPLSSFSTLLESLVPYDTGIRVPLLVLGPGDLAMP